MLSSVFVGKLVGPTSRCLRIARNSLSLTEPSLLSMDLNGCTTRVPSNIGTVRIDMQIRAGVVGLIPHRIGNGIDPQTLIAGISVAVMPDKRLPSNGHGAGNNLRPTTVDVSPSPTDLSSGRQNYRCGLAIIVLGISELVS